MQNIKIYFFFVALSGFILPAYSGEKINQSVALEKIKQVRINNIRGKVKIIGIQDDEFLIKGTLDDDARGLKISKEGSLLVVEVEMPHHLSPVDGSDLEIKLPRRLSLMIHGVSSAWQLVNVGESSIHSVTGAINIKNIDTTLIEVVNAPINIDGINGDLTINAMNGNIEIDNVTGSVNASTMDGHLKIKQQKINNVRLSSVNGVIEVSGVISKKG